MQGYVDVPRQQGRSVRRLNFNFCQIHLTLLDFPFVTERGVRNRGRQGGSGRGRATERARSDSQAASKAHIRHEILN